MSPSSHQNEKTASNDEVVEIIDITSLLDAELANGNDAAEFCGGGSGCD